MEKASKFVDMNILYYVCYLRCFNNNTLTGEIKIIHITSDATGSVLNRKTEPKCQKPNRLFFIYKNRPIFTYIFLKKSLYFFLC